jgi:DNA-directed RNA polymerase subunit beta
VVKQPEQPTRIVVDRSGMRELDPGELPDFELLNPSQLAGTHTNAIPIGSAVHAPRLFYGGRFFNQAMPLQAPEAPWVQSLVDDDPDGNSFDDILGKFAGGLRAEEDSEVEEVTPTRVTYVGASGKRYSRPVHPRLQFNRKTNLKVTPLVAAGDRVTKGTPLTRSNYTDDKGTLALGVNARIGVVPYKGYSMDDAIVISQSMANKLTSEHSEAYDQDFDETVKGGVSHYTSLFPHKFSEDQIKKLSPEGVVTPGTVVRKGDPLFLATRPRTMSSQSMALGKLSRVMRQTRADASQTWDEESEGVVTDVAKTKTGWKVVVESRRPAAIGDKLTVRSGGKAIISKILGDDRMPKTVDGQPLEVLLNPLSLMSRVNGSFVYEALLGKVASKLGKPLKISGYTKPGEDWRQIVRKALAEAQMTDKEEVFDPETNSKLARPITVGNAYVSKLHHVAASKSSGRGVSGYDADMQPSRGAGEGAQAKRQSGLETGALRSAGAYETLRENMTVRGQKNDDFWKDLRAGQAIRPVGSPFVWDKFQALISGTGMLARKRKDGTLRMSPMSDRDLDDLQAIEVRNGDLVHPESLEPIEGGLFDKTLVGGNRYGFIRLPEPIPNPAMEPAILKLLGLTKSEYRAIMAGTQELPEHLR